VFNKIIVHKEHVVEFGRISVIFKFIAICNSVDAQDYEEVVNE